MADHPESRDGFVNPSVKYEHTDLSLRAVLTFAFSLAVALVLVFGGVWWLVPAYLGPARPPEAVESWKFRGEPGPNPNDSHLPAKPELEFIDRNAAPPGTEGASTRTIQEQVAEEEKQLNGYGWVDEKEKIAHIPIEEAMKRLAARPGGKP